MIIIFDGETSSKSMLLLIRRHLVFRFFYDKIGECSLRGCILVKITHVGGTLMILIFDGETSSKSMLLLMRRHLVFRSFFYDKIGECSLRGCILIKITHVGGTLMILIFDGETSSKSMLLLMRRHWFLGFCFFLR